MKIFIYGDSNTWGYVPNTNGYSKNAVAKRYNVTDIWWYPLTKTNDVKVNGLCGRAINNDNPWLKGRNATKTIFEDLNDIKNIDLVIVQLGTNDCKSSYGLSAKQIADNMENLLNIISLKTKARILLISPAVIKAGNKITDKYYIGAEEKSKQLDLEYKMLAKKLGCCFMSGLCAEVGEDGEHLTKRGHKQLAEKALQEVLNVFMDKQR